MRGVLLLGSIWNVLFVLAMCASIACDAMTVKEAIKAGIPVEYVKGKRAVVTVDKIVNGARKFYKVCLAEAQIKGEKRPDDLACLVTTDNCPSVAECAKTQGTVALKYEPAFPSFDEAVEKGNRPSSMDEVCNYSTNGPRALTVNGDVNCVTSYTCEAPHEKTPAHVLPCPHQASDGFDREPTDGKTYAVCSNINRCKLNATEEIKVKKIPDAPLTSPGAELASHNPSPTPPPAAPQTPVTSVGRSTPSAPASTGGHATPMPPSP